MLHLFRDTLAISTYHETPLEREAGCLRQVTPPMPSHHRLTRNHNHSVGWGVQWRCRLLLNQLVTCPFEIPLAARMWKSGGGEEGVDETGGSRRDKSCRGRIRNGSSTQGEKGTKKKG